MKEVLTSRAKILSAVAKMGRTKMKLKRSMMATEMAPICREELILSSMAIGCLEK
jgi:hypothetical protein